MRPSPQKQEANTDSKTRHSSSASDGRRWDIYNLAKENQKRLFPILLHELCLCIEEPEQIRGRPRLSLRDMIFCAAFKVFLKSQLRQFKEDLCEAYRKEFISRIPHYNSVSNYLNKELLTSKLTKLVEISSFPLQTIESNFAVDSTGLSTGRYARWLDERSMKEQKRREWIKVHLICGVRTKIVTCVITSPGNEADSPHFKRLVWTTSQNFKMREVYADKGYLSGENMRYALLAGAKPFIPFKSTNRLDADYKSTVWRDALYMFLHRQDEFRAHYNQRNNVETVFHMIKSMSGPRLASVSRTAQFNEALCKVLCHNICVLIHAIYELGIDPSFCLESSYDSKTKKAKLMGQALNGCELARVRKRLTVPERVKLLIRRKRSFGKQSTEIRSGRQLIFDKSPLPSEDQSTPINLRLRQFTSRCYRFFTDDINRKRT